MPISDSLSGAAGSALLVCLILFLAFLGLFARQRTGWVLLGFFRILGALFAEPVRYLNRMIQQQATLGVSGPERAPGESRSLLGALLSYLQLSVVVGALGLLAAGTYLAWEALLPPEWATRKLAQAQKDLASTSSRLAEAQARLTSLEGSLSQKKIEAVARFKADRQQTIARAQQEMAKVDAPLRNTPAGQEALSRIRTFLATKQAPEGTWELDGARNTVDGYVNAQALLDDASKQVLHDFASQWHDQAVAAYELAHVDESQLARQLEDARRELANQVEYLKQEQRMGAESAAEWEKEAAWRPGRALVALGYAVGRCLGFIWAAGLLLEVFERALGLVGDVREIRRRLPKAGEEAEAAEVEG